MNTPTRAARMKRFVLGIGALLLFSNVLLPALTRSCDKLEYMAAVLDDNQIDASAYYYSDLEVVSDANRETSNTIRFMPTGPGGAASGK
ncbi:hypothetical protein [Desulfovibrio psychrotolerans]|uniref:Uncharacterized protein n=1 Tax=Desulfovibrio psychrotolerans TaxID=415242 RepID=A0A7J0BST8_9BACT|nr:hypothetical protein [Desulfovibrio psychrotolerans]GFM36777.1 hypothetical protein DSM19430T_14610 [Desulfovibrio psychrotolerans]